jgi:molybdopterin converting factor subunit 1
MNIKIRFFAHTREIAGTEMLEMKFKEGTTGEDLLKILGDKYPKFRELSEYVALAVNEEYVNRDRKLEEGDTISLIPPVSGG